MEVTLVRSVHKSLEKAQGWNSGLELSLLVSNYKE